MSIRIAFEAQLQDLNEAREEILDLAEEWNIQVYPDDNSISLSFCPVGVLEIQFEQDETNQWTMAGNA